MRERPSREEFSEIIEAVGKRPKLHTGTGAFNEVTSFLEGFAAGANLDEGEYHSPTTPFRKWVAFRLRYEKSIPVDWESTFPLNWDEFLEHFSLEAEALSQIPVQYSEYCRFRTANG